MLEWPQLLLPPLVGGVVGYFTNDLAVRMLFHPLKPVYLWGYQLPFTPGLVPAEQHRLAERIAKLVVETLLTKDDIQTLAKNLLTSERIEQVMDAVIEALLADFEDSDKFERLVNDISDLLAKNIQSHLPELVKHLSEKSLTPERIRKILDQLIDSLLENFRLSPAMAHLISEQIVQTVLSPPNLRLSLLGMLTPSNIEAIDDLASSKVGGKYGILLFFMNLPETLNKLKNFLEQEPERAEEILDEILNMMHLEDVIYRGLIHFNPKDLPWEKIAIFKENLVLWIHHYLTQNYELILSPLLERMDISALAKELLLRLNPSQWPVASIARIKLGLAQFIHAYLERELFRFIEYILEMANIQGIIENKIRDFSPGRMEEIILEVSKKELNMIVIFGGLLGFVIGCMQSGLLFLVTP